jgi:hypothetical protein
MTFQECELAILRHAVDESEKIKGQKITNSEEIKKIIKILENFILEKKCICYGGTAINNILPKYAQFYNKDIEIPDYDFFTPNALEYAKELVDIYYANGYNEVEAKSGMHYGTFKVYVNFIPIADITYLYEPIFESIKKDAIQVAGILYAPPNFLRMSMYLELSRPAGDVSRWEKVLKRLNLLNKYYPFGNNLKCETVDFQRKLSFNLDKSELLYITARDSFIDQGVVFFGGYASTLYSKYMPKEQKRKFQRTPDFDVLSEEPEQCSAILREHLINNGFKNVQEIRHEEIGELIPERIEIRVGKDTIAFIYYPIACHNYNTINIGEKEINVATIDTMLSFYLAFIYTEEYSFFKERILCMAKYLFEVEQKNRLEQKGLLKRFNINCIGKQPTLEDIRAAKTTKFKELSSNKTSKEYEMWFLKYVPVEKSKIKKENVIEKEPVQDVIEENNLVENVLEKKQKKSKPKKSIKSLLFNISTNKTRKSKREKKGYLF